MKLLYIVITFSVVISCQGQEHLTCLRSAYPPSGSSVTPGDVSGGRVQAVPGKKGPMGEKGESGAKGEKGDAGVADNSLVEQLRGEISSLQQKLDEATRSFSEIRSGFVRLDDGWVGLFNGLQYKYITSRRNHSVSRDTCRGMGATLAYRGIQDMGNRQILRKALRVTSTVWIGLTEGTEGSWSWDDNTRATDATILWYYNQPNDKTSNNCGRMRANSDAQTVDDTCINGRYSLCEKAWNN